MASGKKNYFRHSIFARKDPKLVQLIDEHGKEAYFHYFSLLELCAEVAADEFPVDHKFVFRRSTLCHELRVTNSRLGRHLVAMQSALLCHAVLTEKMVEILLPNLSKYMGKYEPKNDSNSPNKRKEKESKVKESKVKESKVKESGVIVGDCAAWVDALNESLKSGFTHSKTNLDLARKLQKLGHNLEEAREVIEHKKAQWFQDEKMNKFLRPATLFGSKFPTYLEDARNGKAVKFEADYERFMDEFDLKPGEE